MLKSLLKTSSKSSSKQSSSATYKVAFVEALLSERKFFISLVMSLIRIVGQAIFARKGKENSLSSRPVPAFEDDTFLENEFKKLSNMRSNSSQPPQQTAMTEASILGQLT